MRRWLLVAILILTSGIVSSQGMLILTTDNVVDTSLAQVLSGITGATIVTAEKEIYSEPLMQRLLALRPERIIIIGDSSSISLQTEKSLRGNGFPVRRITGATDTQKSIVLFREFESVFYPKAVVCMGRDALMQATLFAVSKKYPLFITDSKGLKDLLATLRELGIKEYVLFSANRQGDLKGGIKEKMEKVKSMMELARRKTEYLTQRGADVGEFGKHLASCQAAFNVALRAYEEGDLLRSLRFIEESLVCLEELDNNLNAKIKSIGGML